VRHVLAVLLLGHGFAHLVGFVVPWRLAKLEEMPYKTTLLGGRWDVGDAGIRGMGILWLLVGGAFLVLGGTAALTGVLPGPALLGVAAASTVLCVLGWPDSKLGLPVNVVIVALFVLARSQGWLPY
jgi:hypothetical protein